MLDISLRPGRSHRNCNGVNRRDFLRVGGIGTLGLSLSQVLAHEAATGAEPKLSARAKSVVLVFLGGGLSHHDTFDMKPAAPEEIRGKYSPIGTHVPGLAIGELLPQMAKSMDKVALVRSGSHNNDHHETATNWVLSGRFGSAFGDYPAIGAVVAHELGYAGVLPPYMAVPNNPSFTWELGKSAYLGGRYESFKTGDPNEKNFRVRDVSPAATLSEARSQRRESMRAAIDNLARRVEGNDQLATFDEFRQRAATMILSPEAQSAFAIEKESETLRDRYGRTQFGQSCLLARRLVERGVRFVTVNYGGWDHHAKIFESLDKKLPDFDRGFATLVADLDERGLLSETLVVCMGEFGRTPKINKDAGRDHWAPAGSMLFAGAGVHGGQVIGATDREGSRATENAVAPADVAATIYRAIGVDPNRELHSPDGRPIPILDGGQVVRELYG